MMLWASAADPIRDQKKKKKKKKKKISPAWNEKR